MLEKLELYSIAFKGLSPGNHVFEWQIDDKFFAMYDKSEISDACVNVQVTLWKHSNFLELKFVFSGWAEVSCSRCLDPMRLDVVSQAKMYVRFGSEAGEDDSDDNDVITLPYGEDRLNIAQYLYEYSHLSLPIRRVHPENENGESMCNAEMISKLEQFLVNKSSNI